MVKKDASKYEKDTTVGAKPDDRILHSVYRPKAHVESLQR